MNEFLNPEDINETIINFTKDYFKQNGFENAFIALSGGVDSATSLYLTSKILNSNNIFVAFFPSSITSQDSKNFYFEMTEDLKIKNHYEINIDEFIEPFIRQDKSLNYSDYKSKLRKGNIMARIRMILSYDIAAKNSALVVGTENKTEYLLGYSTQWGDSAAAFHPLGDIYKTEVFKYAEFLGVPPNVIKRIPSAELWEDQEDEKEIGLKYEIIDKILYYLFEKNFSKQQLLNNGFSEKDIDKIIELKTKSEYKRRLPLSPSFKNIRK